MCPSQGVLGTARYFCLVALCEDVSWDPQVLLLAYRKGRTAFAGVLGLTPKSSCPMHAGV